MSKKTSNLLLLGFFIGFFAIGYVAFKDAMPEDKNERVYEALKPYFPYTVEQRLGGFTIIHKPSGDKEKPPASEVLKRIDAIDKAWGKTHLQLKGTELLVVDKNSKIVGKIQLQNEKEVYWVKSFFGK